MSHIIPYIECMFKGVEPSWKRLILSDKLRPCLNMCLASIDKDLQSKEVPSSSNENYINEYIRPSPSHIFEAFKYFSIRDLKVIIIGQDPYPDPAYAHGLSFSAPNTVKIPASLKTIYKCLLHNKLINKLPTHPSLVSWAKQGVLLLNTFLTRTPNIEKVKSGDSYTVRVTGNGGSNSKNSHPFWREFTETLLKCLSDLDQKVLVMLWGSKAYSLESAIHGKLQILKWGHPSPLNAANRSTDNSRNFIYCDHFNKASEMFGIDWNPE